MIHKYFFFSVVITRPWTFDMAINFLHRNEVKRRLVSEVKYTELIERHSTQVGQMLILTSNDWMINNEIDRPTSQYFLT